MCWRAVETRRELMDALEAGLGNGDDLFLAQVQDEILKAANQTSKKWYQNCDYK